MFNTIPDNGLWGTIAGLLNDNYTTMQAKINDTNGFGFYIDDTSQSFSDGVVQTVTCNKSFANESLPSTTTTFYDSATSKFTPDQAGGLYGYNVTFDAVAATRDKLVQVVFVSPDAIAPGVDLVLARRTIRLVKDAGIVNHIGMYSATALSPTMLSHGVQVTLEFEGTAATVTNVNLQLLKLNAPII